MADTFKDLKGNRDGKVQLGWKAERHAFKRLANRALNRGFDPRNSFDQIRAEGAREVSLKSK